MRHANYREIREQLRMSQYAHLVVISLSNTWEARGSGTREDMEPAITWHTRTPGAQSGGQAGRGGLAGRRGRAGRGGSFQERRPELMNSISTTNNRSMKNEQSVNL